MDDSIFIHPSADVQTTRIGSGTRIWQFVVVLPGAVIGKDCNLNAHCFVENDVTLGDRVTIKSGVQLWNGVHLDDDVFIGPNATFTNDLYPRSKQYPDKFLQTHIGAGASIGANATILCGRNIGARALIGAGSVITRDVPPDEVWAGNPARFVRKLDPIGQPSKN